MGMSAKCSTVSAISKLRCSTHSKLSESSPIISEEKVVDLEQWAAQQAREIVEMVENLYGNPGLLDLVKARVLVIEARGAMRESNEARMKKSPSISLL